LFLSPSAQAQTDVQDSVANQSSSSFIETSSDIFYPENSSLKLQDLQKFPALWWSVLALKSLPNETETELCNRPLFKDDHIALSACSKFNQKLSHIAKEWARDLPLRWDRPTDDQLHAQLDLAVTRWSMLMGPEAKAIADVIKSDPFYSFEDLLQRIGTTPANAIRSFEHKTEKYWLVPIQLDSPPDNTDLTRAFLETSGAIMIGPHNSTFENKTQVLDDVKIIGIVGPLLLILGLILFLMKAGWKAIRIVIPLFGGFIFGALSTYFFFGSLHGLTVSFGFALLGLSFDYGFHSLCTRDKKSVWISNFFGLLTTLAVIALVGLSSVPLFQQISVFTITGLSFAFLVSWFVLKEITLDLKTIYAPKLQELGWIRKIAVGLTLVGALAFFLATNWEFSLKSFDFKSSKTQEFEKFVYNDISFAPPLLRLTPPWEEIRETKDAIAWSKAKGYRFESPYKYLPTKTESKIHLKTWQDNCDSRWSDILPSEYKALFSDFIQSTTCEGLSQYKDLDVLLDRAYVNGVSQSGMWLNIFMPPSEKASQEIKKRYPEFISLKDFANGYSKTIQEEMIQIFALSFLSIMLLSFALFRNFKLTGLSLIPMFSSVSVLGWYHWLTGAPFGFVSTISLIMVLGFSIDYGIFLTRSWQATADVPNKTWLALQISGLTSLLGFLPLVFAHHPVLFQLGITLTLGLSGTLIGAHLIFPSLVSWAKKEFV
jgi:hypothetical protein